MGLPPSTSGIVIASGTGYNYFQYAFPLFVHHSSADNLLITPSLGAISVG